MKLRLAILLVLVAGAACAQTPDAAYQARFAACLQEARNRHYEEARYNIFMVKCMHETKYSLGVIARLPALPPAAPSAAPPPASPPSPTSPRAVSCNQMIAELGIKGAQAQQFLQRCLAAH
jgi:hypothetical protein